MTQTNPQKKSARGVSKAMSARPIKLWQDHSSNSDVRIEIIPLIDVIFCILTFFILAAVSFSRQQAISVDMPKAKTGTPQMREMMLVSLDDFGQVYLDKQVVTRNQLQDALKNYYQFNPSGQIVLNASRNASYNEVVQVLDLLKEVGGDRVALATLPGKSEESDSMMPDSGSNSYPYNPSMPGNSYQSQPNNLPGSDQGLGNQFNPSPGNPYQSQPNNLPGSQQGLGNQFNPSNPSAPSVPTPPNTTPETQQSPVPETRQ